MSIETDAGMQMPGGSVADIQSDAIADNLEDADTLADMKNADPDLPDVRDQMNDDAGGPDLLPNDTPIEDEDQLYNTSDVLDGGNNSSDLGAEQAGLSGDRATGLSAR